MIGQDKAAAELFIARFRDLVGSDGMSNEEEEEFVACAQTALHPRFPGAILLDAKSYDAPVYYAVSSSAAEWRRLQPLLLAFAGPTLTSFGGWPGPFMPKNCVESFLSSGNWYAIVRLHPGKTPYLRNFLQKSLLRMYDMVVNAPKMTQTAPQPTSRLMARFVDCLNGSDRTGAEQVIEILQSELRVDALNLSFLRVQLYSHFCDWRAITEMPEFRSLCYTRKPQPVAEALLESLYQTQMSEITDESTLASQSAIWLKEVRPLSRELVRLPISHHCGVGVLTLSGLEALYVATRRLELEVEVLSRKGEISFLAETLEKSGRTGTIGVSSSNLIASIFEPKTGIEHAQVALTQVENAITLTTIREAFAQIGLLDENSRVELLKSEPFRSVWQSMVVESGEDIPPVSWIEWISRLEDLEFNSYFSVLKMGIVEWPASSLEDSAEIKAIAEAFYLVPDSFPSKERIADSLPHLVAWLVVDPQFPRDAMLPIYEALLYHLVLGARRAAAVYDSAALLIRAMLGIGLLDAQYRALLDDCLELAGEGIGTRHVYWLLDIVEETVLNPSPNIAHRQLFWHGVYGRLSAIRAHLSPAQRFAISKLAVSLGWEVELVKEFEVPDTVNLFDQFRNALKGKHIAIYSLTESAAKQAAQALTAIAPTVKVSLSSDTCGTPVLKSLAQNADIFVVVTASAKHAATGFIQQNRPNKYPILFAAGRGFTSIVRAVEDFLSRSTEY